MFELRVYILNLESVTHDTISDDQLSDLLAQLDYAMSSPRLIVELLYGDFGLIERQIAIIDGKSNMARQKRTRDGNPRGTGSPRGKCAACSRFSKRLVSSDCQFAESFIASGPN
jgi:hypothetical protein